jgi:uncharacterized protein YjiS (DUF1127 family)
MAASVRYDWGSVFRHEEGVTWSELAALFAEWHAGAPGPPRPRVSRVRHDWTPVKWQEDTVTREELRSLTAECLRHLLPKYRDILTARFGLDGQVPQTYVQIAATLSLTKSRIRQLEMDALRKLREVFDAQPHLHTPLHDVAEIFPAGCPLCRCDREERARQRLCNEIRQRIATNLQRNGGWHLS